MFSFIYTMRTSLLFAQIAIVLGMILLNVVFWERSMKFLLQSLSLLIGLLSLFIFQSVIRVLGK